MVTLDRRPGGVLEERLTPEEIAELAPLRGRVAVAMPLGKMAPNGMVWDGLTERPAPSTFINWTSLLLYSAEIVGPLGFAAGWGMPVSMSRTTIAEVFLSTRLEWLWWVDSDMLFPQTMLCRMLLDVARHPQIKVLSGTARKASQWSRAGTQCFGYKRRTALWS
jgi:hypothetical protein